MVRDKQQIHDNKETLSFHLGTPKTSGQLNRNRGIPKTKRVLVLTNIMRFLCFDCQLKGIFHFFRFIFSNLIFLDFINNSLELHQKHFPHILAEPESVFDPDLPCPRTRDTPLSPPSTLAEIFRHACLQSRFHQISPFSGQNRVNWGCRGDSPNIFFIGFLIFLLLRSPCKIPIFRWVVGVPEFFLSLESSYLCYLGAHAKI